MSSSPEKMIYASFPIPKHRKQSTARHRRLHNRVDVTWMSAKRSKMISCSMFAPSLSLCTDEYYVTPDRSHVAQSTG